MPWYILPPFIILKFLYPIGQPARLEKMTSVRGQSCPIQRGQASKAFIGPLSNRFDNKNHINCLGSNKSGCPKAFAGPEILIGFEASARPP